MSEQHYREKDEVCASCGCTVGGGCPESSNEERARFVIRHPESHTPEEIVEAEGILS